MTTPEIEELKSLVEQKYGKILATTTDFEEFSLYLEKKASGTISPSTLKRLYGYVSDNHKPRMVTLDVLSQYIGHRNYMEFTHWLKTSTKYFKDRRKIQHKRNTTSRYVSFHVAY